MATEIEIKCIFNPTQTNLLIESLDTLGQAQISQLLDNQYFDTPDLLLNKHRCALRIRRCYPQSFTIDDIADYAPHKAEQTLKTAGQQINGIFQRNEWNWPLEIPDVQLNSAFLAEPNIQAHLPEDLDHTSLKPLFRTIFLRRCWLIEWQGLRFEAAIDLGSVRSAHLSSDINELEIECLNGGSIDQVQRPLQALVSHLQQTIQLSPSTISKAHMGYQLADKHSDTAQ